MAKFFELQCEWAAREWEALKRFHQTMRVDVATTTPDTPTLPGIFIDKTPVNAGR